MLHDTCCLSLWQYFVIRVEEHLHAEDELDTVWGPSFSSPRPRQAGRFPRRCPCQAMSQHQTNFSKEIVFVQFIQRTSNY